MALYLVTGVAGFIGSNIARALVGKGESVRGIDNFSTGKRSNLADLAGKIDFREVDILDPDKLLEAMQGVNYVLHQAALPSVPKSVLNPVGSNEVNINGTVNVLVAARDAGVRRVVYAASSSAYGDTPTLPKHEAMTPNPISPYAVQKLTGELYMTSFARVYGIETVSLRYFNIFGPFQDASSQYSGVLAKFITQMLNGEQPTIYGDGEQSRDFTFVDNAVQANLKAALAPKEKVSGKVFNVATGTRVNLKETFSAIAKITGFKGQPAFGPDRAGDVKHSLADISAAQNAFGYDPQVSFEEGLARTIEWYRTEMKAAGAAR